MLVPSRDKIYSQSWKPMGQRTIETSFIIPLNNNVVHQCKITWEIREDLDSPSWMTVSSEKLLGLEKSVLPPGGDTEDIRSVHPKSVDGKEFKNIAFISKKIIPELAMTSALIKAGIIEDVPVDEAKVMLTNHVENVESYMNGKQCEERIRNWIESHNGIGSGRIKPKSSLFKSTLDIFSCSIL